MKFECEEIGDGFLAKLSYSKQKISLIEQSGGVKAESGGVKAARTSDAIVRLIEQNPGIKISDIGDSLSVSKRTVERWVSILRKQGSIEYRGSDKTGGYYVVGEVTSDG